MTGVRCSIVALGTKCGNWNFWILGTQNTSYFWTPVQDELEDKMGNRSITEAQRKSKNCWNEIVDQIVRLQKNIFPKHESLEKNSSGLLYIIIVDSNDDDVMFSCPSSLTLCFYYQTCRTSRRAQLLS